LARLFDELGISPAKWQVAFATAALLFAVGSLWLFIDRTRWHSGTQANEPPRSSEQAPTNPIAVNAGASESYAAEVDRRDERPGFKQPLARPVHPRRQAIFSALLSPVLVRGGGDPHVLMIPPETDLVCLQMKTDRDETRRFQVSVSKEGRQVWKSRTIKPHIDGDIAVITVNIPADKMARGDYILTLSAGDPGKPEEVNRYYFGVIRR
jgi:hypothetical protein